MGAGGLWECCPYRAIDPVPLFGFPTALLQRFVTDRYCSCRDVLQRALIAKQKRAAEAASRPMSKGTARSGGGGRTRRSQGGGGTDDEAAADSREGGDVPPGAVDSESPEGDDDDALEHDRSGMDDDMSGIESRAPGSVFADAARQVVEAKHLHSLGLAHQALGEFQQALQCFDSAIRVDPTIVRDRCTLVAVRTMPPR